MRASFLVAVATAAAVCSGSSSAYTLKLAHSFCAQTNCTDGEQPFGSVVMDQSGDLFGVTQQGGAYGYGEVYELVPNGTKWIFHRLHSFCKQANCTDGSYPVQDLIIDTDGNLYGVTFAGGLGTQNGLIYKLTHTANGWTEKAIYKFNGDSHGGEPAAALSYYGKQSGSPWDEFSPLFGTTWEGGKYGDGVVYVLATDGGNTWSLSVIHSFSSGNTPGPVLVDSSFNLYGETEYGGKYNGGTLYKLAAGSGHETTLHNFCASANCTDGQLPYGGVIMDISGNIFGVTNAGGSSPSNCAGGDPPGCGVVFERTAGGTFKVLYNFCLTSGCPDGSVPDSLMLDASGRFFGTAVYGGSGVGTDGKGGGAVFQLFPGTQTTLNVLYSFCDAAHNPPDCTDGSYPDFPLVEDAKSDLFGMTYQGGLHNEFGGEVFELQPF